MWICPNCNCENETNLCTNCGAQMPQEAFEIPSVPEPVKKSRSSIIITCCVLCAIGIVLIVLLLILIFGKDDFHVSNLHTIAKPTAAATVSAPDTSPVPVVTQAPTPTASPSPAESGRLMDTDRDRFIEIVRKNLGVPDDLSVTAEVGELAYWEGADTYIVRVSFSHNGEMVASASVDPNTGELARSIIAYTAPSTTPATTYKKLSNSLFGFSIEYPSFLTQVHHAQNSAGSSLSSADGSVDMQIYGDFMAEFGTTPSLSELFAEYKNRASYDIGYELKKDNWFILSGELNGMVYYEKHFLKSDGTHNWFLIEYPKSREKEFDPIVTHLVKTFRTGVGANSSAAN